MGHTSYEVVFLQSQRWHHLLRTCFFQMPSRSMPEALLLFCNILSHHTFKCIILYYPGSMFIIYACHRLKSNWIEVMHAFHKNMNKPCCHVNGQNLVVVVSCCAKLFAISFILLTRVYLDVLVRGQYEVQAFVNSEPDAVFLNASSTVSSTDLQDRHCSLFLLGCR